MDPSREVSTYLTIEDAVAAIELASDQAISYGLTSITEPGVIASGTVTRRWADAHAYQVAVESGRVWQRTTLIPSHPALHALDGSQG